MGPYRSKPFFLIVAAILVAAGTFAASWYLNIGLLYGYLVSLNLLTFFIYGYDKRRAIIQKGRVPEVVLHLLALAAGSPAALAGQIIFRHKTQKQPFKFIFVTIILIQIMAISLYLYFNVFKAA